MAKPKRERPTNHPLGLRVNQALREKGIPGDYAALASHFDVKVPSVYGWVDSGRISKDKLPRLVEWSGHSLDWWLNPQPKPTTEQPDHVTQALSRLQTIGLNLTQADWQTVIQVAQQLASKNTTTTATDMPSGGVIASDKLQELAALQATAEELHAQSKAKPKRHRAA